MLCRTMGRSFASSPHRTRREFASSTAQEEEEGEEKGSSGKDGKCGSQGIHLEGGANAYQVLGVSPSCSPEHLREAFTKLAKLTHPDLQSGPSNSAHFILVLSAYQILSSPARRAQYDAYLRDCSQSCKRTPSIERKSTVGHVNKEKEVVEWLRWYRRMAMNMVHEREIGSGGPLHDEFRANLQEAMQRAFFGPDLDNDGTALPHCFEAEERAEAAETEVLHLVSGQRFIGAVLRVGPKGLLEESTPKLEPVAHSQLLPSSLSSVRKDFHTLCFGERHETRGVTSDAQERTNGSLDQSAFVDLELYLYGNLVARATRAESKTAANAGVSDANILDEITVYLCHDGLPEDKSGNARDLALGTIVGLNRTETGGKGMVYSSSGDQTHIIWQFRTPWVKHVHWFKVDGKRMLCECKSSRARLPSSKYWLFEPRCEKHNIGGWYIETLFRRGKRGSMERRGATDWAGKHLGLLHPAMYIFGTAYKTLDTENLRKQEKSFWSMVWGGQQTSLAAAALRALRWCKVKVPTLRQQ